MRALRKKEKGKKVNEHDQLILSRNHLTHNICIAKRDFHSICGRYNITEKRTQRSFRDSIWISFESRLHVFKRFL